jgi:hypothetical protein
VSSVSSRALPVPVVLAEKWGDALRVETSYSEPWSCMTSSSSSSDSDASSPLHVKSTTSSDLAGEEVLNNVGQKFHDNAPLNSSIQQKFGTPWTMQPNSMKRKMLLLNSMIKGNKR